MSYNPDPSLVWFPLCEGDVVELHGAEGTGKTEALYHLIVRCLLPANRGGLEVEVVFVDTDYHFDTLRLVTILEARLAQSQTQPCQSSDTRGRPV